MSLNSCPSPLHPLERPSRTPYAPSHPRGRRCLGCSGTTHPRLREGTAAHVDPHHIPYSSSASPDASQCSRVAILSPQPTPWLAGLGRAGADQRRRGGRSDVFLYLHFQFFFFLYLTRASPMPQTDRGTLEANPMAGRAPLVQRVGGRPVGMVRFRFLHSSSLPFSP